MLLIRAAATGDLPVLLELWRELERAQGPYRVFALARDAEQRIEDGLREAITAPEGEVLIAEDDAGPAGMAVLWTHTGGGLTDVRVAELSRVVVRETRRGTGVGRALLAEAEQRARAAGAAYLEAKAFTSNADGLRFWEHLGFAPRYVALVRPVP